MRNQSSIMRHETGESVICQQVASKLFFDASFEASRRLATGSSIAKLSVLQKQIRPIRRMRSFPKPLINPCCSCHMCGFRTKSHSFFLHFNLLKKKIKNATKVHFHLHESKYRNFRFRCNTSSVFTYSYTFSTE